MLQAKGPGQNMLPRGNAWSTQRNRRNDRMDFYSSVALHRACTYTCSSLASQYSELGLTLNLTCTYIFRVYLDWMGIGEGVKTHSTGIFTTKEVGPDIVLWVGVVNTQVLDPGSKTLV